MGELPQNQKPPRITERVPPVEIFPTHVYGNVGNIKTRSQNSLEQLTKNCKELSSNLLIPLQVREMLNHAVMVLDDHEKRLAALEGKAHG